MSNQENLHFNFFFKFKISSFDDFGKDIYSRMSKLELIGWLIGQLLGE